MKFSKFFKIGKKKTPGTDGLAYFLLNATEEEKIKLFTKAAHQANKDQQDMVERSKKIQAV